MTHGGQLAIGLNSRASVPVAIAVCNQNDVGIRVIRRFQKSANDDIALVLYRDCGRSYNRRVHHRYQGRYISLENDTSGTHIGSRIQCDTIQYRDGSAAAAEGGKLCISSDGNTVLANELNIAAVDSRILHTR